MNFMLRPFIFLILLISCGSLKTNKIDPNLSVDQILSSVPLVGEGRGRIGIKGQQYVFSYDALLRDNADWLFSASIPMHGEELMIFPDLKSSQPPLQVESFERRIEAMLKSEIKSKISSDKLMRELRHLVRFMLSANLKIKRDCEKTIEGFDCFLENKELVYTVKESSGKKILIERRLSSEEVVGVEGENFQDGRFLRTNFSFVTGNEKIFSLELIWK